MTEINRQAPGLNDLVQVQSGGKMPDDLAQTVRPTIDIEPYYLNQRLRGFSEGISLSASGKDFIEVPEGQLWLLNSIGVEETGKSTVGDVFAVTFSIEGLAGQGFNGVEFLSSGNIGPRVGALVNSSLAFFRQLPRLIHVSAGQRIVITLTDENLTIPVNGTFEITYYLLNVV